MAFVSVSASAFTGTRLAQSAPVCSVRPARPARRAVWCMNEGKGFGGGEATRNPDATEIDPNDPKGKQKAIHPAETFADYQARIAREKEEAAGK